MRFISFQHRLTSSTLFLPFLLCFLAVVVGCKNEKPKEKLETESSEQLKIYNEKRIKAIYLLPEMLGIDLNEEFEIYGIVLDWNLGNGQYVTFAAYENGRAILYTSDNLKDMDITHANIKNAIKPYINRAYEYAQFAGTTISTELPVDKAFKFYFLTSLGLAQSGDNLDRITNRTSPLLDLFNEGNEVIAELRSTYIDFVQDPEAAQ
jgi:hypothetical protein